MESTSNTNIGPVETSINQKLTKLFNPHHLKIENESSKHAHHAAMRADPEAAATGETHFNVTIVSDLFEGVAILERHRMVNECLKQELEEKGLHALSIKAKTLK